MPEDARHRPPAGDSDVAALHARISQLEQRVTASQARVDQLVNVVRELATTSTQVFGENDERLRALEGTVAAVQANSIDANRQGRRIAQLTDALATRLLTDAVPRIDG